MNAVTKGKSFVRTKFKSERALRYIVERASGFNPTESARRAGYAQPSTAGWKLEKDPDVKAALAMAERRRVEEIQFTRNDLLQELREALLIAKMAGDPNAIVRAVAEINKMNGNYAVQKHEHTLIPGSPAHSQRAELEIASEEDLLAMLGGPDGMRFDGVIEGEFTEVLNERIGD